MLIYVLLGVLIALIDYLGSQLSWWFWIHQFGAIISGSIIVYFFKSRKNFFEKFIFLIGLGQIAIHVVILFFGRC